MSFIAGQLPTLTARPAFGLLILVSLTGLGESSGAVAASPAGIYSSGGPTTAFNNSVDSRLDGLAHVDGALVRIEWKSIETAPGVYDWQRLDEQFARAEQYGLGVSLGVVNGLAAPAWLDGLGAQTFSYDFHGATSAMPVPWDEVFLQRWTGFVAALGDRYGGNSALSLVHITTSSANGFEMQIPYSPTDAANWNAIGYTVDRHAAAYEQVIDAFGQAFPDTPLDLEVHPVLGSDEVAERAVAYANETLGDRFGVFAAWWSQKNADSVYPGMYQLLRDQAAQTFAGVQFVTNATNNPDGFGDGGIQATIDRALADGIGYFEPWDVDLLNSSFADMFDDLHEQLAPTPVAGDFDGDGEVSGADFLLWQRTFGVVGAGLPADGDGSGAVDAADLAIWQNNLGMTASADLSTTPEPRSALLLLTAFAAWLPGRRRRLGE